MSKAATSSGQSAPANASANSTIEVTCSCGKKSRVPLSAAGKAVRCKCGVTVPIPKASSTGTSAKRTAESLGSGNDENLSPLRFLTDADWAAAVPPPVAVKTEEKPKRKANEYMARATDEMHGGKKERKSSAGGELNQSRMILLGIGLLKIAIGIYNLVVIESMVSAMVAGSEELAQTKDSIMLAVRIVYGIGIGIGTVFMVLGGLISFFPLTCTIVAIVLFVLAEIYALILNPFLLFSIWAWIIRAAIFGALVQAINNAGYYRYVKSISKEK
ncbi:MAG: hypothetical protein ABL921_35030 [Pirellula sp.]